MTEIRDYVYLSIAKLNRLSTNRRRGFLHGTEREWEVGVPGAKVKIKPPADHESPDAIVDWVANDLRHQGLVGTVDDPKKYFSGLLRFKWGPYPNIRPPIVFFLGATESTVLALGGRAIHAPGWNDEPTMGNPTPELSELAAVNAIAKFRLGAPTIWGQRVSPNPVRWYHSLFALDEGMAGDDSEEFEFLAIRHAMEDDKDPTDRHRRALLGSPIYVARVL